jgi:hypothetical protein
MLTCALLFGGMVLYSFGFAAFLFTLPVVLQSCWASRPLLGPSR